ncbi:MAG: iron ABC transporter permease [Pseudomonadota bacterium]
MNTAPQPGAGHPLFAQARGLTVLGAGALAATLLSLAFGSADIPFSTVLEALAGQSQEPAARVVLELRLPRALTAFGVGGLLGLSGALLQVLVRNALADPYIMGTAGGAAAALLVAVLAGIPVALHAPAAFTGAMLSLALLSLVWRHGGSADSQRLVLTGVGLAAGWGALVTFLISVAPPRQIPGLLFWLLGDLGQSQQWHLAWAVLGLGTAVALLLARPLNLLTLGELPAAALGVETRALQRIVLGLAALLTGVAVSIAGPIGFAGLVAPHLVRLALATDHRILLPGSVLAGGTLVALADLLARTLVAPMQLPVGVLTALLGVPLFLWLLNRSSVVGHGV